MRHARKASTSPHSVLTELREAAPTWGAEHARLDSPIAQATAPNPYLMLYPKPQLQQQLQNDPTGMPARSTLLQKIWTMLGQLQPSDLIAQGRVYGGGLYKLEPKELGRASLDGYACPELGLQDNMMTEIVTVTPRAVQLSLF